MSKPSWIGQTLGGRYRIRELLGQGGMSAVYKADDPNLRRVVAVKLIHGHLSGDREFVRRFEEEAAAVAKLRHSNIIQVYDFDNDGETYFIVFEFIPGESLQSRLQRLDASKQKLPYGDIIHVGASVADALAYAHRRGIVHRDIKPANVMLNVQGEAILMDFGIVKIVGGDSHTATGAVLGTARYMSPEQIKGEQVDPRSDIYSMGVMLFEMASGRVPFEADSAMTLMMMHVTDPVPDLRKLRPDVPPDLIAIINKALAKDKTERYQSAAELKAALREVRLDGWAEGATKLEAGPSATQMEARTQVEPQPASEPSTAAGPRTVLEPRRSSRMSRQLSAAGGAQQPALRPPAQASPAGPTRSRRNLYIGGAAAALVSITCLVVIAVLLGQNLFATEEEPTQASTPVEQVVVESPTTVDQLFTATTESGSIQNETETPESVEPIVDTPPATPTDEIQPTARGVQSPTDTPSPLPTYTAVPQPTDTPPPPPTESPTPTQPQGPAVRINSINLNGTNYVVDYTPVGYTPALPGEHVHFFFNTVPPENAGVGPTQETWFVYGGPNPFTGYTVNDRPNGATQMCALFANPDHTIVLNTGNCVDLPG